MTAPAAAPAAGLRGLLARPGGFTVLTEVVPWRGALDDDAGARARRFAADLRSVPGVDAVSVTDGAGGRAVLSPETLAADLAAAGQQVLVHVTCRDRNRNELAALGWRLASAGLNDLLVLSGDYPHEGFLGVAKPVFDLDSVSLLELYSSLGGPAAAAAFRTRPPARATWPAVEPLAASTPLSRGPRTSLPLHLGVAVNPFKTQARDAVPQYLKLELKARTGARFAITQAGYDARRWQELHRYVGERGLPLQVLAGIYVLSAGAARAFHAGRVPGVSVSDALLAQVQRQAASPDKGRAFFLELAATQVAVARGLGLAGVSLSGLSDAEDVARVLQLAGELGGDRWPELLPRISWADPGGFWFHSPDPTPGRHGGRSLTYTLSRLTHEALFVPGSRRFALAGRVVRGTQRAGLARALHLAEQAVKRPLYGCRDCGDCSLPDIAFLCPESACVKNQRNGPCGGSRNGECEVPGKDCIWARAYDRLSARGLAPSMLERPVAVQDNALRHSSSWANALTGQDLHARRMPAPSGSASPGSAPSTSAPSTSAPSTSAPSTSAPSTSAPPGSGPPRPPAPLPAGPPTPATARDPGVEPAEQARVATGVLAAGRGRSRVLPADRPPGEGRQPVP